MENLLKFKNQIITFALLISILLISSCQPIPTPTEFSQEKTPEPPENYTTPRITQTLSLEETDLPGKTPTPTTTPVKASIPGTPLPSNREIINIENVEQIQHLGTWGIGSPNDIQLSKDGQVLGVGTGNGIHFYDTKGLYEIAFRETPHAVRSIAFSSDNETIAVGQSGGSIDIYNRVNFSFVNRLKFEELSLPDEYLLDCFFIQEVSKLISVVRTDQVIIVNHWSYGDWVHNTSFSVDNGLAAFISPDIGTIGIINEDSLVFQSMFYPEDNKQIALPASLSYGFWENFVENHGDIAPTADGEGLLINNGSAILYWEILSDEITYQLSDFPSTLPDPCQDVSETCLNVDGEISWVCQETTPPPIETITLTSDDMMLLVARNDDILELRRVHDGLLAWEADVGYTKIRFSPGSEFFFGVREDGLIEKRGSEIGSLLGTIEGYPGQLHDIAFSPDGKEIAAGTSNGWIQIINAENGQILDNLEGNAHTLDFSPDGSLLAAGSPDGSIRVFTLDNGGHFDLEGHFDSVNDVKFSEDGQFLLSGSADCTIRLWDIEDRERTQTILPGKEEPFQVLRIDFSPAETLGYLVGDISGLIAAKEDAKYTIEGLIMLSDFAVSQNKQTLAITGSGTSIFTEIQEEGFSTSHLLSVKGNTLALNGDGTLLAIATDDSLEFWSTRNRTEIYSISLQDPVLPGNGPIQLSFSPDNTLIALGYQNGLIEIFGIPGN